jgi:hypothetical protein
MQVGKGQRRRRQRSRRVGTQTLLFLPRPEVRALYSHGRYFNSAVGSTVVQIAKKVVGCKKVIGIAGGKEKCDW